MCPVCALVGRNELLNLLCLGREEEIHSRPNDVIFCIQIVVRGYMGACSENKYYYLILIRLVSVYLLQIRILQILVK